MNGSSPNPPTQLNDCGKHIEGYLSAVSATHAISKKMEITFDLFPSRLEFKVDERSIGVHSIFNTDLLVFRVQQCVQWGSSPVLELPPSMFAPSRWCDE